MGARGSVSEGQLREQLVREGLRATRWSNGPHATYAVHDHPYGKVLLVAAGSITFRLPAEGREVPMRPGDRLELAPRTAHSAVVGAEGVVCLEAHRDAGARAA